ncbi:MAG: prepilin-type N-terminal cleavage/methylation domain-containing protein [Epulopiscium sp.]|nr:prepilin-type N-terminal cleavage/methylation domain-containing protein [Candidatus Epulonipiscium sp.]
MKKENGFTLIELIIVVSMISLMSCIIVPSFHLLERVALKQAAQELKMNIQYTQKRAIQDNKRHWLRFYDSQNLYIISSNVFDSPLKKIQLSPDIKMKEIVFSTSKEIKFTEKGTTGSGGHLYLQSKNFKVKLTVMPGTGRVKIFEIQRN